MVQDCYTSDVKAVNIDTTAAEYSKATKNTISNTSNHRRKQIGDEINWSKMCNVERSLANPTNKNSHKCDLHISNLEYICTCKLDYCRIFFTHSYKNLWPSP